MSTRSVIVKHYEQDNCFKSIYCHLDGYPEGVGSMLKASYKDANKINQLIQGGDISYLDETLEGTSFYIRDWEREVKDNQYFTFNINNIDKLIKEILKIYSWSEYIYIFYKNEWLAYTVKFGKTRNTAKKIAV